MRIYAEKRVGCRECEEFMWRGHSRQPRIPAAPQMRKHGSGTYLLIQATYTVWKVTYTKAKNL